MSGLEPGIVALIVGNAEIILPIIISIVAIMGSIVGFIRYLKKNVTEEVVALRNDVGNKFNSIEERLKENRNTVDEHTKRIVDRMAEIKQMIEILDRRITEIKSDTGSRMEAREEEVRRIDRSLESLRLELQRLEVEQARRSGVNERRLDDQNRRIVEQYGRMSDQDERMSKQDVRMTGQQTSTREHRYDTGHQKHTQKQRDAEEVSSPSRDATTEGDVKQGQTDSSRENERLTED